MDEKNNDRNLKYSNSFDGNAHKDQKNRIKAELRRNKRVEDTFTKRNIINEESQTFTNDPSLILQLLTSDKSDEIIEGLQSLEKVLSYGATSNFIDLCIYSSMPLLAYKRSEMTYLDKEISIEILVSTVIASISNSEFSLLLSKWIPTLIDYIPISDSKVQENIYWILGNIALDSENNRFNIFENRLIEISQKILESPKTPNIAKKVCWCVSHCCKARLSPLAFSAIPVLGLALKSNLIEILPEVLWAFCNLSQVYKDLIVSSNILPLVVKLSKIDLNKIQHPALRILGNMLNGTDDQIDYLIGIGLLRSLSNALESRVKTIRLEALWGISNICTGVYIKKIISSGLFKKVIELAVTDCLEIQKETIWSISNAIAYCESLELNDLIDQGLLSATCFLLSTVDPKSKLILLKTIWKVLQKGEADCPNPYASILETNGGKETIESLANSHNTKITSRCSRILRDYFDSNTDEMELVPTSTFAF